MTHPTHPTRIWLGVDRLRDRIWTRRCRGCDAPEPHTHHLTWLGRRRWTS